MGRGSGQSNNLNTEQILMQSKLPVEKTKADEVHSLLEDDEAVKLSQTIEEKSKARCIAFFDDKSKESITKRRNRSSRSARKATLNK